MEKERLVNQLEVAFEKRLAAKEEEIRHLKAATSKGPAINMRSHVEELETENRIKEEAAKALAEEVAKLKEQVGFLRRRLDERQRLYVESEKAYEELISKLREQQDSRVQFVVKESTRKEAALMTSIEEERAKMQQEKAIIREKEKQIEETLQAFAITSQKMIALSGSDHDEGETDLKILQESLMEKEKALEERKSYITSKEADLKKLLESTEQKIMELKSKEANIEMKEQILLKEQEALNKELEVLNSAGIEISKTKDYIKQKLEQVDNPAPEAVTSQKQEILPEALQSEELKPDVQEVEEEEQAEAPKVVKSAKPTKLQVRKQGPIKKLKATVIKVKLKETTTAKQKILEKPVIKPIKQAIKQELIKPVAQKSAQITEMAIGAKEAENRTPESELFTEIGGYSEIDEIKSIVEVGLQHGDSVEQIRESLMSSGYSKANIEKALSTIEK